MEILVSNDDGYHALGIQVLASHLSVLGNVTVVAPERNRSGSSSALTLERPLRARQVSAGVIAVDGTPTDCVHLALTGLLDRTPDMVVTGINNGPNLGDDVLYSGTVAGAIEGRFLGFPAIALSMASFEEKHFETAAELAVALIKQLDVHPLPADTILNVNVPDIPKSKLKGLQCTRLGNRHKSEPLIRMKDPKGRDVYWIGPPGLEQDAGEGTDFFAVNNGYASVTPLQVDLTRHTMIKEVSSWLQTIDME
ncbi:MAG: 5'/3'-nucleotidase SurE [Gammaproteobacteria bacterium]|nr:5'/3'-nucleotidase SurE [Gammaproteobacteria bacterium]MDH5693949.1 5'/3'-nucleotidase SurE [Gammaproteobacteria bacterium]